MSKKTNSLLMTILLLLVIIAGGYVYFSGMFAKTTLELSPSSYSYFTTSEPEIEVVLNNPKNAKQGELALSYDTKVLKLQSSELADGVNITKQNETLLFELTEEYFKSNDSVALLKFELVSGGETKIEFVEENIKLLDETQNEVVIEELVNGTYVIGGPGSTKPSHQTDGA